MVSDLREAEARIGRLSSSQRDFIIIQSKKNSLIELGKKRNREEDALLRRLQTKLFRSKRDMSDYDDRLLIKPKSSAKSVAERVTKSRASQGKKSDPTGADRKRGRGDGHVIKLRRRGKMNVSAKFPNVQEDSLKQGRRT